MIDDYRLAPEDCDHNEPEGTAETPATGREWCKACGRVLDESIVQESDKAGEAYVLDP